MRRSLMAAAIALSAVAATPVFADHHGGKKMAAEMPTELNFGIISTESSSKQAAMFAPLLADMEKAIGVKVKAFYASDYAGVIEGMRFNKVQVAWYGNKSAMEAVDRASGEIFTQTVALDGSKGYYSLLITQKDSPYKSLQDVLKNSKDIRFGIGDPNSTSGFLVPSYYVFALNNVDPKQAFKSVTTSNHEGNLLAVSAKQVDVAVNNTESLERFQKTQADKAANVKEIWRSPLIPSDPLVWRKDLNPELKKKIADFFLNYGKAAGAEGERQLKVLEPHLWKGFIKSDNNQLLPIRQLELYKSRNKVAGDSNLADADKKKQLADLDAKLADLEKQMKALKK
jgi:phosphonate transport system substrate-binding protein